MDKKNELIKLREEEQLLLEQLKALRERSTELNEQPEKEEQKKSIDDTITTREASLDQVRNEINALEGKENKEEFFNESFKEKAAQFFEGAAALSHLITGHVPPQDIADALQKMETRPAYEMVIENPSHEVKTGEELIGEMREKFDEKVMEAYEAAKTEKPEPEKNAAKEWEKVIDQKEDKANEKYDKELANNQKSEKSQLDYIEKKYGDTEEKNKKTEELKDIMSKVNADVEKDRNSDPDIQKINEERNKLNETLERTKNWDTEARQQEIEKVRHEYEKQLELERQRQLAELNKART